ncbi:DUF6503 family protein [Algoriphagus namhaensis]|uniref:DUF6503 family protein n=1 Tax=Algoriphagus namhaensis TaxID=915353 RepID=A0ABV8AUX6_9BACT
MMRPVYILLFAFLISCTADQNEALTGPDLIKKSIAYHDPNGIWPEFKGTLRIQDSLPEGRVSRRYDVSFDNTLSKVIYRKDDLHFIVWGDSVQVFEGEVTEERAKMLRNYYTYLWGLPMKLNDPGTLIDEKVLEETLDGVRYHVVRVPYEKDIWYFYLEPETYRMAAYKFYQDEPNQKGEIIYLEGETEFEGMKIPSNRTWYRTEKPEFLATDMLLDLVSN